MYAKRFLIIAIITAGVGLFAPSASAQTICPTTAIANGDVVNATVVMSWFSCKAPTDNPSFTGSVGIGTTTPNIGIGVASSVAHVWTLSTMPLDLGVNSTTYVRVTSGGNVGIGNTAPSSLLDVAGVIRSTSNAGAPASGVGIDLYYATSGSVVESYDYTGSTSKNLYLAGTHVYLVEVSDGRLKTNVSPLSSGEGLQAILALRPVSFDWKDAQLNKANGHQIGLIAQEVQKVFPGLISQTKPQTAVLTDGSKQQISDPLGVDYKGLIVPLVKAVQEQEAEIAALKQQVDALRANRPIQK